MGRYILYTVFLGVLIPTAGATCIIYCIVLGVRYVPCGPILRLPLLAAGLRSAATVLLDTTGADGLPSWYRLQQQQ